MAADIDSVARQSFHLAFASIQTLHSNKKPVMLRGLAKHHTSSETDMVFRLKRKERAALEKYLEKNPNAGKTRCIVITKLIIS